MFQQRRDGFSPNMSGLPSQNAQHPNQNSHFLNPKPDSWSPPLEAQLNAEARFNYPAPPHTIPDPKQQVPDGFQLPFAYGPINDFACQPRPSNDLQLQAMEGRKQYQPVTQYGHYVPMIGQMPDLRGQQYYPPPSYGQGFQHHTAYAPHYNPNSASYHFHTRADQVNVQMPSIPQAPYTPSPGHEFGLVEVEDESVVTLGNVGEHMYAKSHKFAGVKARTGAKVHVGDLTVEGYREVHRKLMTPIKTQKGSCEGADQEQGPN